MKEKLEKIKLLTDALGVPLKEDNGVLMIGEEKQDIKQENFSPSLDDVLKIYGAEKAGDVITVTTVGTQTLLMVLKSLFCQYDFEVIEQGKISINQISNEKIQDNQSSQSSKSEEVKERDFTNLAERLDNDFTEIEVFEDKLEILGEDNVLEQMAKLAEKMDETLEIEVHTKKIVIK